MQSTVQISVAVVEPVNRARTRLVRMLKTGLDFDTFNTVDELRESLDDASPTVAVFGPTFGDEPGIKEIRLGSAEHPLLAPVLVVEHVSTELLQQALRGGIRDVIPVPRESSELLESVARVAESFGKGALAIAPSSAPGSGRVITTVSTKGGAGKSVVASNLAALLAKSCDKPVALVDADLQFGDIAIMLNLAPKHTIVDVIAVLRRLEAGLLKDLLLTHESTGLLVLPAPIEPAFADQVGAGDLMRIINTLRSFCAYTVIDTSPQLNDIVLGLLEESDEILLVCPPEVPSVKNAKLALQTFRLLNIPLGKVRLVVNRSTRKGKITNRELEQVLELRVEAEIPSDPAVPDSVNEGVPVALLAPRSDAAKGLRGLAGLVMSNVARS